MGFRLQTCNFFFLFQIITDLLSCLFLLFCLKSFTERCTLVDWDVFWVSYQMLLLAPGQADLSLPSGTCSAMGSDPETRKLQMHSRKQEARGQGLGSCVRLTCHPPHTEGHMSSHRWLSWSRACRCWWAGWRVCSTMPSATPSMLHYRTSPRSPSGSHSGRPSRRRRMSSRGQPCCTHLPAQPSITEGSA